jgi:hypothetical protein
MIAFSKIANCPTAIPPLPAGEGRGEGEQNTNLVGPHSCAAAAPERHPKIAQRFNAETAKFSPRDAGVAVREDWSRTVKPCQALSGPVKRFSEKKSNFLSFRTALHRVSLFGGGRAARCPHPKSTLPYSKSTLDLGCEGLIWVENGFVMPRSGTLRHTFHPITTRPSKTSSQMPNAAKLKKYLSGIDLRCALFVPFIFQNSKNPAK